MVGGYAPGHILGLIWIWTLYVHRVVESRNSVFVRKEVMKYPRGKNWIWSAVIAAAVAAATPGFAADAPADNSDVQSEIAALKSRIAELEKKEGENWMTAQRVEQIKAVVQDVIKETKAHEMNGWEMGYNNGFFVQSADKNFKLVLNGYIQPRYEYVYNHRPNSNSSAPPLSSTRSEDNASGFDVRRARIKLTGNVFSPNIIYKFYGDFYGANNTGGFSVLEAFVGYNFNDAFKFKVGAMDVPFTKTSREADTNLDLMVRPEVFTALMGVDTQRTMGAELYGDIIKDKFNYELQINNGVNSNQIRRPDTNSLTTANLDNRLGFYGRLQFAGNGIIKDFDDEPDLRKDTSSFIWMVGGGLGYESQNASPSSLPAAQNTATTVFSNGFGPGFTTYALNGDIYRATLDWSAKYQGWSFLAAGQFQQINANPFSPSSTAGLPLGPTNSSFFEHAYYASVGYMIIPKKLELVGRAEYLFTEDFPNIGEYYTVGANYYIMGNNVKIQTDVTYTPEAVQTDTGDTQLQNSHDLIFRMQFQVSF
jgi:hypothetical protein